MAESAIGSVKRINHSSRLMLNPRLPNWQLLKPLPATGIPDRRPEPRESASWQN
jgi:hypothetical protein